MKKRKKPAFESKEEWNAWVERMSNLPISAGIISENGAEGSMTISSAKVVKNGIEEIIFEDEIELKTNNNAGDKIAQSKAVFTAPQNNGKPQLITHGNASISNKNELKDIAIKNNKKKLKTNSDSGLFASAKIGLQRDTNQPYFQLFFGITGKKESVIESGTKDRPHIDFYPSGNGKYIRLAEYKCKLKIESGYEKNKKIVFSSKATIELEDYDENLELKFTYENEIATLQSMNFKIKHNKT